MTHEHGKSDRFVVPMNSPNVASEQTAEAREGRERTKGNTLERNVLRTQRRVSAPSALERVRQAAAWRGHPRWEPDAVTPHVRFCAGGDE